MPFIAYLSQTLNKNNKQRQLTSPSLSALRRPNTHQHPDQRSKRLQGVCILIKQDARVHYPTINSNASTRTNPAASASPHNPIRCSYRAPSGEGGKRQPLNICVQADPCDSSGPNSVSRPDQVQEASGSTPHPEGRDSTEKHTRRPAGCSSTIPLASSTITTQPNAV